MISRDVEVKFRGELYYLLSIHSIKDGKLRDMDMDYFSYVCEDGILEVSGDYTTIKMLAYITIFTAAPKRF